VRNKAIVPNRKRYEETHPEKRGRAKREKNSKGNPLKQVIDPRVKRDQKSLTKLKEGELARGPCACVGPGWGQGELRPCPAGIKQGGGTGEPKVKAIKGGGGTPEGRLLSHEQPGSGTELRRRAKKSEMTKP